MDMEKSTIARVIKEVENGADVYNRSLASVLRVAEKKGFVLIVPASGEKRQPFFWSNRNC